MFVSTFSGKNFHISFTLEVSESTLNQNKKHILPDKLWQGGSLFHLVLKLHQNWCQLHPIPTSCLQASRQAQQNGNESMGEFNSKSSWRLLLEGYWSVHLVTIFCNQMFCLFKTWLMCIWIFCTVLHWSTHCWFHFAKLHHFGHRSWGCCLVTLKRFMSRDMAFEL